MISKTRREQLAAAGRAGTGKSKRRGNEAYYRRLVRKRWRKHKKKKGKK